MIEEHRRRVPTALIRTILIYLILILSRFVSVGLVNVIENSNSDSGDQGAYLQLGLEIKERKALTDGNGCPLYPASISLFAEREWGYFTRSKLLSLAIGTIGLIVLFSLSRCMYSDGAALLATFLLSINERFGQASSRAECESLLVLLFFVAWYYTVKGFSRWRYWMAAGFFAGLAYLTKTSGQLPLLSFLLSAVILYKREIVAKKQISVFLAFYFIAASVLFAYNYKVYHDPLYNYNTTHVAWFDSWGERDIVDKQSLPTISSYLKTHTLRDILVRQWSGMKKMIPVLAEALIPVKWETLYNLLSLPFGLLIALGISVVLVLFKKKTVSYYKANREKIICTGVLASFFYLSFAWYARVVDSPRFVIPLAPIAYLLVADLTCKIGSAISTRFFSFGDVKLKAIGLISFMALYLCLGWWLFSTGVEAAGYIEDPFRTDRLRNADGEEVLLWLKERAGSGTTFIWGPSHSLPGWKYANQFTFVCIPSDVETWEVFEAYLAEKGARFIVLDEKMFKRRRALLSQWFDKAGHKLLFKRILPGWEFAFAQEGSSCNWYVLEPGPTDPASAIQYSQKASLGDKMGFLGYSIDNLTIEPGDTIRLSLYWRAQKKMATNYTVFTHLLDRENQIWGQADSFPMGGMYPTSSWHLGDIIVDKYEIPVGPEAPLGVYRLEIGMYDLSTQERLPVYGEDGKLSGDRIVLKTPLVVGERTFEVPKDIQHPMHINLDAKVTFLGYDLKETRVEPGGTLHLTLYWQAQKRMDTSYKVFTYLLDSKGQIWGQKDGVPGGGYYPTTGWLPGEVIVDEYEISVKSDAPSGDYAIEVGMYEPETMKRLAAFDENQGRLPNDRILLDEEVRVRKQ